MEGARRVTLGAAAFALICFFMPWVQVSCVGIKDSASGLELTNAGERLGWLIPSLMILVLATGLVRFVLDQKIPAVFALIGTVGGGLSAYLMYRERLKPGPSSALIAGRMTLWFWLGLVACLVVSLSALVFYMKRSQSLR
jgi:hypothetical protein